MKVSTQLSSNFCFFIFSREFHSMFSTRLFILFFSFSLSFFACAVRFVVVFCFRTRFITKLPSYCAPSQIGKLCSPKSTEHNFTRKNAHKHTHTFAFVHQTNFHTGRTTCNSCWTARRASGRAAAQQPTSPTLVDYLIGIVLQRPANAAAAIAKRRAIAMYQLR